MSKVHCVLYALSALLLYPAASALAEDHSVIVISQGDRTIYDTDPATGKLLNKVQMESTPAEAIFSYNEKFVFVSLPELGCIVSLDAKTFKEANRLCKPEFKRTASSQGLFNEMVSTPNYRKLYVSIPGGLEVFDQWLLIYNPEFKQPEKKIMLPGKDPQHMLAHGPSGKVYYAFRGDNQVTVIDTNTDAVLKTIPVKGGPTDVAFNYGSEAWIASESGLVTIISTKNDEVIKTIDTGGKGLAHIVNAIDQRYIAVSHDGSDDVTLFQPLSKEILGTVKLPVKAPLSVRFLPPGHGGAVRGPYGAASGEADWKYPFVTQLYVTGNDGLSIVDVPKLTAAAPQSIGQNNVASLIHFTYPDAFTPPREPTATRIMENDTYTLYNNAMANYDESPIHEHRTDLTGVQVGEGHTKIGCWDPKCPPQSLADNNAGRTFDYGESHLGLFTGNQRGTLHQEEGISAMPREIIMFMLKNNYYRQVNPKKESDFAKIKSLRLIADNTRSWMFDTTLQPGKPIEIPEGDHAFVYLAGGIILETKDGVPEIDKRLFKDWEIDTGKKTVEALRKPIHVIMIEFK